MPTAASRSDRSTRTLLAKTPTAQAPMSTATSSSTTRTTGSQKQARHPMQMVKPHSARWNRTARRGLRISNVTATRSPACIFATRSGAEPISLLCSPTIAVNLVGKSALRRGQRTLSDRMCCMSLCKSFPLRHSNLFFFPRKRFTNAFFHTTQALPQNRPRSPRCANYRLEIRCFS
ncbi:hypothetical protein COCSADRAFT_268311 [Bipolaris sorokiniana ND90Pr]|uniref:Uncharacterized protein n=1 Tax=Cochliobolus sativus (strain ND90Pr / ATCC 201652) TaxID=665912 RepID=M2T0I0_COCSN|nr:uncharacterized protein COCSADRAFT_268311 [Bipolaris sorokiniana ND90Pr]EMD68055.1 hypothetical protein COCSADRAFT_268311 [Bipolaris sorokiniana ND90Pr]